MTYQEFIEQRLSDAIKTAEKRDDMTWSWIHNIFTGAATLVIRCTQDSPIKSIQYHVESSTGLFHRLCYDKQGKVVRSFTLSQENKWEED